MTVFMPVYNRANLVTAAIDSILCQTYRDLELLVVDDGSTDETPEVLSRVRDPRVRIVRNEKNLGIPATRNLGLELAHGEFLAMLDSDDRAVPRRLEKQIAFLDAHPDHAVVGSWAWRLSAKGRHKRVLRRPVTWQRLRARLLFVGTLRTPSVTGRLAVLRQYRFRNEFEVCSDSDLWSRLALETRCANLPEPLIDYRVHGASITNSNEELVRDRKMAVAARQLELLGMRFNAEDLARHHRLRKLDRLNVTPAYAAWAHDWLSRLIEANREQRLYPEPWFCDAVAERWHGVWRQDHTEGQSHTTRLFAPPLGRLVSHYLVRRLGLTLRYGVGVA